jgi:hypothetical protein
MLSSLLRFQSLNQLLSSKKKEAFAVPSVRAINGKGKNHAQLRLLPDNVPQGAGKAYEAGVTGMTGDEAIRESSQIFSNSNDPWGTGKSEIGGDPILLYQEQTNPCG